MSSHELKRLDRSRSLAGNGCVALFMGKRAVEKAAAWKSPTAELSHSAWKSRDRGGISHFSHRPDHEGIWFPILSSAKNS